MTVRALQRQATTSLAVLVAGIGLLLPTSAAHADPGADASTSRAAKPASDERPPLTPEQVREQLADAQRMEKKLEETDAALAAASARLAQLSATSNALMNDVTVARVAQQAAEKHEAAQKAKLKKLAAQTAAAKRDLENMAYDAYVNGPGSLRDVAALVDLVAGGGDDAAAAGTADYLASARNADQKRYAALTKAQQTVAQEAAKATAQREAATAKAQAAQAKVAAAVTEQQRALVELQKVAGSTRTRLEKLGVDSAGRFAGVDMETLSAVTTTPLCSQDTGVHPNGMIPGAALCSIPGSPGHMMRPEATRALSGLKQAYAKAFGEELCITDTYRSYAAQVDVKRRKPYLAATPGTSNHGLGLATDLCGGIENFGTPQHQWMQQHAPLFGFFHPAWAQANGSKPEPWHWEFAS